MPDPKTKPDALEVKVRPAESTGSDIAFTVRFTNTASRALHYISDVRTTKYDPATRTLTVSLSDEGRVLVPGAIAKLPVFRHIDPGAEAEIQLRIPNRVVKFSRTAPPGEIAFDVHQLSEAEQVVINVGWSDVPYYPDTRRSAKQDEMPPSMRWQQFRARAVMRLAEPAPPPPPKRPRK